MSETKEKKQQIGKNTIIGKSALLITARGQKEVAAQVFNYDSLREVRLDMENKEIKILMNYDQSYYRVFQVQADETNEKAVEEANQKLFKFYNDLLYAAMKLTKEEVENLNKQIEKQRKEHLEKVEADKKAAEPKVQ